MSVPPPDPGSAPSARELWLERRVRRLAAAQLASWGALGLLALSAFGQEDPVPRLPELPAAPAQEPAEPAAEERPRVLRAERLEVERIDVFGPHGRAALVLSGRRLMPGPRADGAGYPPEVEPGRERSAGLLFYDETGDEVGALVVRGAGDAADHDTAARLAFHGWKQDAAVAVELADAEEERRAGVSVWDRPVGPDAPTRGDRLDAILEAARGASEAEVSPRLRAAAAASREAGVERLFLGSRDGAAGLVLKDAEGRPRARLVVEATGEPRLEFLDEEGKVVTRHP